MDRHPCEFYKSYFCAQRHLTHHVGAFKLAWWRMLDRSWTWVNSLTVQDAKTFFVELCFLLAIIFGIPLLILSL